MERRERAPEIEIVGPGQRIVNGVLWTDADFFFRTQEGTNEDPRIEKLVRETDEIMKWPK